MKKLLNSLAVVLLSAGSLFAQQDEYNKYIQQANSYYEAKQYKESGEAFSRAFIALGNKGYPGDRYNAACSWALAGVPDSAFVQLFKIAEKAGYSNIGHMSIDPDLNSLRGDKRWEEVCSIVRRNKEEREKDLNKPLVAILDTVFSEDQSYRMQIDKVEKEYGRDSKEMKELWKTIEQKDKENLARVTKILDEYGWLGPDIIGGQGNTTLFLVIQHADHKTQLKYLPMMREAVKNRKASPSSLALLEDRVALGEGKKQVYGSQIGRFENGTFYVQPLEDPDNVDNRRAEVGLPPLAEYVDHWQLKWDVQAYKKQLPEIEHYQQERRQKKQ